ncbi:MAG: tol-pal system protein YbgF [Beggiatoa sp. IS2]|nr:MAG: tol-pal system protein YbgF [Beggiatoa sp. IS2]
MAIESPGRIGLSVNVEGKNMHLSKIAVFLCFSGLSACLYAQRPTDELTAQQYMLNSIETRLTRLEQLINSQIALNREQERTQMQQEIQGLRGEIELLTHKIEQLTKEQTTRYTAVEQRLNGLSEKPQPSTATTGEAGGNNGDVSSGTGSPEIDALLKEIDGTTAENIPSSKENAGATGAVPESPPADEEPAYQQAFKWVHQGQYEQVITAFKEFLTRYPQGKHAADAQYWVGESQYALKKFDDALATYSQLMEKYPQSSKYSYAQLKIGYVYAEKKDDVNARTTLNKVKNDYSGTAVARLAEERLRQLQQEQTP